jgi:hypothetical protein
MLLIISYLILILPIISFIRDINVIGKDAIDDYVSPCLMNLTVLLAMIMSLLYITKYYNLVKI